MSTCFYLCVCYSEFMRYVDQIIRMTTNAAKDFVKNVRALPEDKVSWKVLDTGRSALDQFQEVAQSPLYVISMLELRACPPFEPEKWEQARVQRSGWTVDECEAKLNENLATLFKAFREFPEEDLSIEIDLPFIEGLRQSMADIMAYPYWNISYHAGQVCFIQTLYGDKEMH